MKHLDVPSSLVVLLLVFGVTMQGDIHPILPSLAYELADITCCSYVLWMQAVQQERQLLEREKENLEILVSQQARQYEITSSMIDRINQKCHDIKHQILGAVGNEENNSLKAYLHSLADNIMVYDTAIRTGNKALDTVLMEKGLICRDKHIQWTCMADGSGISFIRPGDLYTLFGNLVDNAIEASEKIDDVDQRVINVKVSVHESLLMILVENLFTGEIVFDHGFPLTTKTDGEEHGYGVKSVDYIARSYGGSLNISAKDHICQAKLLIPIPGGSTK
ncbi:ATP-binding protein [Clostridium vitabionis]|uniref:ATP-binding protein n=1 Tax=Clostridium vitabionis TaxID=2784388 RepID=UPI00188B05E1|nr:ATP-binding protein [Clostridium vitabionis]